MAFPYSNQADLMRAEPRRTRERRHYDADGYERTEVRTGDCQCPKCGLWWPVIESPDMWTQNPKDTTKLNAFGWWGAAQCGTCDLLLAEQPDGRSECYDLGHKP